MYRVKVPRPNNLYHFIGSQGWYVQVFVSVKKVPLRDLLEILEKNFREELERVIKVRGNRIYLKNFMIVPEEILSKLLNNLVYGILPGRLDIVKENKSLEGLIIPVDYGVVQKISNVDDTLVTILPDIFRIEDNERGVLKVPYSPVFGLVKYFVSKWKQ